MDNQIDEQINREQNIEEQSIQPNPKKKFFVGALILFSFVVIIVLLVSGYYLSKPPIDTPFTESITSGPKVGSETINITDGQDGCFKFFNDGINETPMYDLNFSGSGLEEWNGEVIRIIVDTDAWEEEKYGVAETKIEEGSFEVMMPGTLEIDYTAIGIYVDTVRDNTCGKGEPLWNSNTGILSGDMKINEMYEWTQRFCDINGMFDLSQPLPCSP